MLIILRDFFIKSSDSLVQIDSQILQSHFPIHFQKSKLCWDSNKTPNSLQHWSLFPMNFTSKLNKHSKLKICFVKQPRRYKNEPDPCKIFWIILSYPLADCFDLNLGHAWPADVCAAKNKNSNKPTKGYKRIIQRF